MCVIILFPHVLWLNVAAKKWAPAQCVVLEKSAPCVAAELVIVAKVRLLQRRLPPPRRVKSLHSSAGTHSF